MRISYSFAISTSLTGKLQNNSQKVTVKSNEKVDKSAIEEKIDDIGFEVVKED